MYMHIGFHNICAAFFSSLRQTFHKLLEHISQLLSLDPSVIKDGNKYTVIIDGVNYMDTQHQANTAGWLPSAVPKVITLRHISFLSSANVIFCMH